MSELPTGWMTIETGSLGEWRGGGTPSKANSAFWTGGTIPWVSPKDMKRPHISEAVDSITQEAVISSATQLIPADSVLIVTRSGILQHSLPVAANTVPVTINQDIKALTPHAGIETEFVMRQLQADAQFILKTCTKAGTTVDSIDFARLKNHQFRLPPLPEQRRIVAKVDGLTARTARARKELNRIPTLITRYKQRLLALAFSGELTADWRSERELAEPKPARLADVVAVPVRNGLSVRGFDNPPGVRALRLSALRGAEVNLDDVRYLPIGPDKASRFLLNEGDILISRGNGTRAYVGIGSRVPEITEDTIFPDTAFRIRLAPNRAATRWFVSIWNSPQVRSQIENSAKTTAGIWKVAQSDISRIELLLPTLEEQAEIVRRIEAAFAWLDRVAADHAAAGRLLPKLDAAILAKAFRGELVPQDPNDEPASVLLERIKAEREYWKAHPKQGRRRIAATSKDQSMPAGRTRG